MNRYVRISVIALCFVLTAMSLPARSILAQSNTIQVPCSNTSQLYAAIVNANRTLEHDTIVLENCAYTFRAPAGLREHAALPEITAPLTIKGNGATIERSSESQARFRLLTASADLTLQHLSFTRGYAPATTSGGAVLAREGTQLRVEQSFFSNNNADSGGAIAALGALVIEESTFHANNARLADGGALLTVGALTIAGGRMQGNTAAQSGGAIATWWNAPAMIHGVDFIGNNVQRGDGGAIAAKHTLSVSNSFFIVNDAVNPNGTARGGAIYAYETLTLDGNIFRQNRADDGGGAVFLAGSSAGPSRIANTVFDDNTTRTPRMGNTLCLLCEREAQGQRADVVHSTFLSARPGYDRAVVAGNGIISVRNSIIVGFLATVVRAGATVEALEAERNLYYNTADLASPDLIGSDHLLGQDPQLQAPAAATPYYALQPGSPAQDAALPNLAATDIRGVHRPQSGAPDIGAYEIDLGALPDTHRVEIGCSVAELVAQITETNQRPGADRIVLAPNCVYELDQPLSSGYGLPTVHDYLEISGRNATLRRAAGAPPFSALKAIKASLHLQDLTFENFSHATSPIWLDDDRAEHATMRLERVMMRNNRALNSAGGALRFEGGTLDLRDSDFFANLSEQGEGGAVYSDARQTIVQRSRFEQNRADDYGGALYVHTGALRVQASSFQQNQAQQEGGAIASSGGYLMGDEHLLIADSVFTGNTAPNASALFAESSSGTTLLSNNLWADHRSDQPAGSVIQIGSNAQMMLRATLLHNTMASATAQPTAMVRIVGTGAATLTNNLFAGYARSVVNEGNAELRAQHNLFWGSPVLGTRVVEADPQFVDAAGGDYRLRAESPARDAGTAADVAQDLDGAARPFGPQPDLGAYEYSEAPRPNPTPGPTPNAPYRIYLPLLRR